MDITSVNPSAGVAEDSRADVFGYSSGGQFAAGVMAQTVKAKGVNLMGAGGLGGLFILPEQGILNARFGN